MRITDAIFPPEQERPAPKPTPSPETDPERLADILFLVKAATGHDFSSYKKNTVLRRIERRLAASESKDLGEYLALLRENRQEATTLAKEILIGVTGFFRDPEAFQSCREKVLPRLVAQRDPAEVLRIWHACCASGEEVYSMAMLIQEYLEEHRLDLKVQFFATDLDEAAVSRARAGVYPEEALAGLEEKRLEAFFTRVDKGWQVSKALREMVVFAHHNLIKDPPFSRLDLLVCRNFLIYLAPDMQKRLFSLFHQVLKPSGFLFLGSAEAAGQGGLFSPVDKKWRIFSRNPVHPHPEPLFPFSSFPRLPHPPERPRPGADEEPSPAALAEKLLVERYSPPFVVVNEKLEVVHFSSRTSRFLEIPGGKPTRDILKMARGELRPALRASLHKAFSEGIAVSFPAGRGEEGNPVSVLVEPLPSPSGRLALVAFEPTRREEPAPAAGREYQETGKDLLIRQLEEQLRITYEQLQAANEQLESSHQGFFSTNEELLSINEELQSSNEELETSREELQALNEELVTVNGELQGTVEELNRINTDMENLLASTEIATVFLDRELNIKRFTPSAASLFNLMPGDLGRPLKHLATAIDWPTLQGDAEAVLEGGVPEEREVANLSEGRFYLKQLHPYRGSQGSVDGIVVTLLDITARKEADVRLRKQVATVEGINAVLQGALAAQGEEQLGSTSLAVMQRVSGSPVALIAELAEDGSLHQLAASHPSLIPALRRGRGKRGDSGGCTLEGMAGKALSDGRGLWNNSLEGGGEEVPISGGEALSALLVVPLLDGAKAVGLIAVGNREGGYGPQELECMEALAPVIVEAFRRSRAEISLSAGVERLRLALEAAKAGIWEWDAANRESSWSQELWNLFGLDPVECLPSFQACLQALHPDDRQGTRQLVREATSRGAELHVEFRVLDRAGVERELMARGRPLLDEGGRLTRYVGIVLDLTELKGAQAALINKEAELATVLETVDEGLVVTTLEGDPVHWNRAALELHGFQSLQECRRMTPQLCELFELRSLDGELLPQERWPVSRILAGERLRDLEVRVRRLDAGWEKIFNFHGALARDAGGHPLCAVVTLSDVTQRRQVEDELLQAKETAEAANRAKSQFLANMSHELRTPMTGVLGMLELALDGPLDPRQRDCIDTAEKSARSLLRILNDILDLTRVEAGKLAMEERPFSLSDCLAGVIDIFIPETKRKGLGLRLSVGEGVPTMLVGDQVRLRQVLTNLCGNAIKFTARGAVELRVMMARDAGGGRRLSFEVKDTGIGIPTDKMHLLFRSFSQIDASNTRRFGGTGLGLAISKEIVEQMGGEIHCRSREGEGSTFRFTIPFCAAPAPAPPPRERQREEVQAATGSSRRPHILVAEDDPTVRKLLAMILERMEYRLDLAEDGRAAVESWEKGEYDLLLMDVQMPVMDGFAATRLIREKEAGSGRHTLIVAMTAHAAPEDEARCLNAGMDAYISKPIDLKATIALMGELIGRRDAQP